MSKCKQCGNCCKGIRLDCELPEAVKPFWKEITEEEAMKLHPLLKLFYENNAKYYNCSLLIDNKCSIHQNKPDICKNYPEYDGHSLKDIECGYFDEDDALDIKLFIASKIIEFQEKKAIKNPL